VDVRVTTVLEVNCTCMMTVVLAHSHTDPLFLFKTLKRMFTILTLDLLN